MPKTWRALKAGHHRFLNPARSRADPQPYIPQLPAGPTGLSPRQIKKSATVPATKLFRRLVTTLSAVVLVLASLAAPANAADFKTVIQFSQSKNMQSIEITAYNPADPSKTKTLAPQRSGPMNQDEYTVPAGWLDNAKIVMKPNYVIFGSGDRDLPIDEFTTTSTGEGGAAYLTYTLTDWNPTDPTLDLRAWQHEQFNYASYCLNGGTWTDAKEPSEIIQAWRSQTIRSRFTSRRTRRSTTPPIQFARATSS